MSSYPQFLSLKPIQVILLLKDKSLFGLKINSYMVGGIMGGGQLFCNMCYLTLKKVHNVCKYIFFCNKGVVSD